MSDNIDYAELDRAIHETMSNESKTKKTKKPKAAAAPPKKHVKARGHYLDIVDPKSDMRRSTTQNRPNHPTLVKTSRPSATSSPVLQDVVTKTPPARTNRYVAAAPNPDLSLPDDTMLPNEAYDPNLSLRPQSVTFDNSDSDSIFLPEDDNAFQLEAEPSSDYQTDYSSDFDDELNDIEQAIQAVEDQAAAESEFVEQPTALSETTIQTVSLSVEPEQSPNANNYALGGRSPFMLADAKVDQRPLGPQLPPHHPEAVQSSKNVYSSRTPLKTTDNEQRVTPLVAAPPKKKSGWLRVIAILLIILGGAALGLLVYFIAPAFFPN